MYENGYTLRKIESICGINRKKISIELKNLGYKIKNNKTSVDHLNENDFIEIIEMYIAGNSLNKIANNKKVSLQYIRDYLVSKNIIKLENTDNIDEDLIYKKYFIDYQNAVSISKELNIPYSQIRKCFVRNKWEFRNSGRTNLFNENIFDSIDTEEKAYWLGFLFGDVYNNGKGIELCLMREDKYHLEKFLEFIDAINVRVEDRIIKLNEKEFPASRITLTSQHLSDTLTNLGCVKKKSLIVRYPNIDPKFDGSFIGGYFDANGCISNYKNSVNMGIYSGSIKMLEDIKYVLEIKNNIIHTSKMYKRYEKGYAFGYLFGGKPNARKLFSFCFDKVLHIMLIRKKNRFEIVD